MNAQHELAEYLGDGFDPTWLVWNNARLYDRLRKHKGIVDFQTRDEAALYLYAHLSTSEWRRPYLEFVRETYPPPRTVLEYHAAMGNFGLQLGGGYEVGYLDHETKCTDFLRWRLKRRGSGAAVYALGKDEPPVHDLVLCFDSVQRYPPDEQPGLLDRLAELGRAVVVNLDSRTFTMDGVFYEVDVDWLVLHIAANHNLTKRKSYNYYVNLVAYAPRQRQRKATGKTRGANE